MWQIAGRRGDNVVLEPGSAYTPTRVNTSSEGGGDTRHSVSSLVSQVRIPGSAHWQARSHPSAPVRLREEACPEAVSNHKIF